MNFNDVICFCVGLKTEELRRLVFLSYSLEKIIKKQMLRIFVEAVFSNLVNFFITLSTRK